MRVKYLYFILLTFSALLIAYSYARVASVDWPMPFHFWPSIIKAN